MSIEFEDLFRQYFRDYGLEVITNRAVADARDGLQPVHRRILYAMEKLHLAPQNAHKKSARVVGDVIGQYHPHGDSSVYEAMVRMAQSWVLRYPLLDGQGNWGSVDGDRSAAMRYTEVRLSPLGKAMLNDELQDGVVDWVENYDGSTREPQTLPAPVPLLLANGTSGIAVGIATDIPPHHMGELLSACLYLCRLRAKDNQHSKPETLFRNIRKHIRGPDFPTGGLLLASDAELDAIYQTGHGNLSLRAKWHVETLARGQWQLCIDELPYMVKKGPMLERMGAAISEQKLPMLAEIRDDSDASDIRILLTPKSKHMSPESIMQHLFACTDLQSNIKVNMHALIDKGQKPARLSLLALLEQFLDYRNTLVIRRSEVRLIDVERRLHLLSGLLIAHLNIDEVIAIIRQYDDAQAELMQRFSLSEEQAKAVLNLRLKQLRRLEEQTLQAEQQALQDEQQNLQTILNDRPYRWKLIAKELKIMQDRFRDERRTELTSQAPRAQLMKREDFIDRDPITLILSQAGWLKGLHGHHDQVQSTRLKEGDRIAAFATGYTTQKAVFFGKRGKVYSLLAADAPSGRGFGEPISKWFDFSANDAPNHIALIEEEQCYLLVSSDGYGFRCTGASLLCRNRKGKQLITLGKQASLQDLIPIDPACDAIAAISQTGELLVCDLESLPLLAKGKGVRIMSRSKGIGLRQLKPFVAAQGLRIGSQKRASSINVQSIENHYRGEINAKGLALPMHIINGYIIEQES